MRVRRVLTGTLLAGLGFCLGSARPRFSCPEAAVVRACPCGQDQGYTTVKAFPVNLNDKGAEYTYIFTSETDYLITACGPEGQNVPLKVSLMDGFRLPLFDNYDKRSKQYRQRMGYVCGQTGVAHLKLEPGKGGSGCAYVFIGFRPQ